MNGISLLLKEPIGDGICDILDTLKIILNVYIYKLLLLLDLF